MAMVGDGGAMMGNVYSPYIRGEALFRTNRVQEGLAEFQKMWIILESDSLIRLARSHVYRYREAIGSRVTKTRHEANMRSCLYAGPMLIQICQCSRLNANFACYGRMRSYILFSE